MNWKKRFHEKVKKELSKPFSFWEYVASGGKSIEKELRITKGKK